MEENQLSEAWLAQEREMIANFFNKLVPQTLNRGATCTAQDCDDFARRTLQTEHVRPVDNQGATSYTLICLDQEKIIQFRLKRFQDDVLTLAHQIYGDLVPTVTAIAGFPLPVYLSTVIPGQIHIFQTFPSEAYPLNRQLVTVTDVARFVARSAHWPQPESSYAATSWTKSARLTLTTLEQNHDLKRFDPRFSQKATSLLQQLILLDTLPPVLSHSDFVEINMFVDPEGSLTGVIDFEDAQTEAFGMCLFGVYESFFGVMRYGKWTFFDQDAGNGYDKSVWDVLETAFWDTLWDAMPPTISRSQYEEAVMVALEIGMVNRYFVRGLLEGVDEENQGHRISLEFARGMLLDR
ncbi:MAG: hypothetical protein M1817_005991 [Caeruleum heppii]|nr:MAG: hypothetical protein M1817_005991 [Caeruleum heppii]